MPLALLHTGLPELLRLGAAFCLPLRNTLYCLAHEHWMGDSSSQLAFLLFIPVLTTLWIWVCTAFFAWFDRAPIDSSPPR